MIELTIGTNINSSATGIAYYITVELAFLILKQIY